MSKLFSIVPRASAGLSRFSQCSIASLPTSSKRTFRATPWVMSDIKTILTKNAMQPAGPYSQAIKTPHAIYCSGQIPADSQGNIIQGTIAHRTQACLKALSAVLTEAGSSLDKVVKTQVFLTDMKDFAEMNAEYEKWVKHKPARSCVGVKQLLKGVNIEIECIALP